MANSRSYTFPTSWLEFEFTDLNKKLYPSHLVLYKNQGKGMKQIDGLCRRNAGATLE